MEDETRLIIINGSPRTGKDHIAEMIADEITNLGFPIFCLSISDHVKEIAHELYGLRRNIYAFESVKDIPNIAFRGLTPRNAYINVSSWIRRDLGPEYLGRIALGRVGDFRGTVLLPGAGFLDELEPLLEKFGRANCLLVRLEGGAWDSRSRLEIEGVTTIDVARDGFEAAARRAAAWACAEELGRLAA